MVVHVDHLKMFHANTPPDIWPISEKGDQHLSPEGDSLGNDAADECDDRVCTDVSRDADHASESSVEPPINNELPVRQFPRISSRKRCPPIWFRDYDMA